MSVNLWKQRGLAILIAAAFNFSAAAATELTTITHPQMEATIQHYVHNQAFQGAVLVAQQGEILHRAAYGWFDKAADRTNAIDTRFLIGSLTKSFTAIIAMQLVEEGKLALDAPLARYVPGLRKDLADKLTLHQLLKHQSGLPVHLERLAAQQERAVSSEEILAIINTSTLAFAPGSAYEYGNLGYHLTAVAIQNVTGKPWPDVLQERIFAPLGMVHSGVERFGKRASNRANGYSKGLLGISHDENNVSWAFGTGDIYSTVEDLYRWDQALASTKLLSERNKAKLFAGENAAFGNYGYGFRIQPYRRGPQQPSTGTLIRHGGSMDGFLSNYHHYLDDQLTVIVLGNIRPFDIRQLTFELKETALGAKNLQRKRTPEAE